MSSRSLVYAFATLLLLPVALAGGAVPAGPVVNGSFELHGDTGVNVNEPLLDTCIGVGHQVQYGSETVQADLLTRNDPNAAAERVASDPEGQARFAAGVGHCVYSTQQGYDLAWVVPSSQMRRPAVGWSYDLKQSTVWGDVDGDGDREARILANKQLSGHNMWQSYASAHQAWTGDFDALSFRVENGAALGGAIVLSLSATPLHKVTTNVPTSIDCQITFSKTILTANRVGNDVSVDPALASFRSRSADCADLAAAWTSANTAGRHAILAKLRLVQLSFWDFNHGATDVVIDDVALVGAKTAAEALLG